MLSMEGKRAAYPRTSADRNTLHSLYQFVAQGGFDLDVFEHSSDEGVAFEVAAHLLEVKLLLGLRAVGTKARHGGKGEFLLGILVDHAVETDDSLLPLVDNANNIDRRNGIGVYAVELLQLAVGPRPLVGIVVGVHTGKLGVDILQAVDGACLDAGNQGIDLALGSDKPRNVDPLATARRGIGAQAGTYLLVALEVDVLQPLDDGIAKELMDGYLVETDTLDKGRVAYLGAMERVNVRQLATRLAQVEQYLPPLEHLLHGVGAEQVVVNEVELVRVGALVALGPFLRIADGAHAAQVDTRHEVGGVVLLDEVGEGQITRVRMGDVAPHDERESTDTGRPENVGVGSGLGTALQRALMDGAQLIHVVALIGTGTGVHKREHTGNEQGGLVVRHRERPGKDGTGLAVLALTVAEEQGVGGRVVVPQLASLPHKTAREHGTVVNIGTGRDDEVVADNAVANVYRGGLVAVDTAIAQAGCPADVTAVANAHVKDGTGVDNLHFVANAADIRGVLVGIEVNNAAHTGYQLGTVAIEGHDVSLMGRELVVDRNFAASGLVENRNLHAVAERGLAIDHNHVHVFNERVATNLVIGYVVLNVLNTAVVAHGDVVERHVAQTGVLSDAPGHDKILFKHTQTDRAGETGVVYIIGCEVLCYLYLVPVV